jgi:hypothetical protein
MAASNWQQKKENALDLLHRLLEIWQGQVFGDIAATGPQTNNAVLMLNISAVDLPLPYDEQKINSLMLSSITSAIGDGIDKSGGPKDQVSKTINAWIELIKNTENDHFESFNDISLKHPADFRSVVQQIEYSFTPAQALCIKILWEEWKKGTPDVSGERLLEEIASEGTRFIDLIKNHPAWNKLISHPHNRLHRLLPI